MSKAMTALAFVFVSVLCTNAGNAVGGFTHGTSFEKLTLGQFDPNAPDTTNETDVAIYWAAVETNGLDAVIATNKVGEAYDYAARKMERGVDGCFAGTNAQYLAVDIDTPFERLAMPRTDAGGVSNVLLQVANAYDGIYADTLVKLSPSIAPPDVDAEDKIIVWLRETEEDGRTATNLVITAGYYAGDFGTVESADYVIEKPVVAADTWCRLTVCALSDITGIKFTSGQLKGGKNPGFVVYIDGTQVVANASYSIGTGYDANWLTPAARVLKNQRGLFPWLVPGGHDDAMRLSRLSFSGQGAVDDILFTTTRPTHVEANNIFTLKWDAGVMSMRCVVSNAVGVVTNEIDGLVSPRRWDCRIGTNINSVVTVTNVVYDADRGYSNGFWSVESGCTLVGNAFHCFGTNPVGRVASVRDVVGVGGEDGYETFAEAKARARERDPIRLILTTNMVISTGSADDTYKDKGYLSVTNGDNVVLDLMGHTLQGVGDYGTVFHDGGKLCIIDSIGGGAVLPPGGSGIAVQSRTYVSSGTNTGHVLTIDAGRYAGEVKLWGGGNKRPYRGLCYVNGGSFTNFNETQEFYLQDYVDPSLYFGLDISNYWSVAAADAFIWCGEGSDDCWTTANNWRRKEVPGAEDLAVFPRITDGRANWEVDFGTGVATKSIWLDADIDMSGTNEFSDVNIMLSGSGRLVGTGTVTFTGKLPGGLTADGLSSEIRLRAGWCGTVRISNIKAAKVLKDIMRWGFAESKVEFAGVRGYLSDRANYALPYELVLTDSDDGAAAWKNDTGYTGSTVSFPRLTGSGTFESPKNLREVLQVFQFKDVKDFTGCFNLGGKRLLLGTGDVVKSSKAGHFTFSDKVAVRSGLGWSGVSAHFGTNVVVYGELNDNLMKYSSATAPAVGDVTVDLHSATTNRQCILVAEGDAKGGVIKIASGEKVTLGTKSLMVEDMANNLVAGDTFAVSEGSAVSIAGNRIIVNGVDAAFAKHYIVTPVDGTTYAVQLDEDEVTPTLAEFEVSEEDGLVSIRVENAKSGLWYGLQTTSSLAEAWPDPTEWLEAVDGELVFQVDELGSAKFFRVIVTDKAP